MTLPDSSARVASQQHPITTQLRDQVSKAMNIVNQNQAYANNPTAFGGPAWTDKDKKNLEDASHTHTLIADEAKNLEQSMTKMNTALQGMSQAKQDLLANTDKLEEQINKIDDHLKQYEERFAQLDQQSERSDEEKKWQEQARLQIATLRSEKQKLRQLHEQSSKLYDDLDQEEKNLEQKLNAFSPPMSIEEGHPSSAEIAETSSAILTAMKGVAAVIGAFLAVAAGLLALVGKLLGATVGALTSSSQALDSSQTLLGQFPGPQHTATHQLS